MSGWSSITVYCMGTEIRTFNALKEISDYLIDQLTQYRSSYDDYSEWLGTLLRSCEETSKNEDWYQKSAAAQKSTRSPPKKAPESKSADKKGTKKGESSIWIPSGTILISSTEQGQAEILFEAVEKIGVKLQEIEKFKASLQQLERVGLGKNVNYVLYIEDDVPKKMVTRSKNDMNTEEAFKFETEFSTPAFYSDFPIK